jgi:hypothetical protein
MPLANRAGANATGFKQKFKDKSFASGPGREEKLAGLRVAVQCWTEEGSVTVIVNMLTALCGWPIFVRRRVFEAATEVVRVQGTVHVPESVMGVIERW